MESWRNMVYDYVIVDSKLVAYQAGFHRRKHATAMFPQVITALDYNSIKFKQIIWAGDWGKSAYRLKLHPKYKGQREATSKKLPVADQLRKDDFLNDYQNLHDILDYVGITVQKKTSETEADDMRLLVRELAGPDANILLFSLDEDWYCDIQEGSAGKGATHLLRYTKNQLIKTPEAVEHIYGLSGENLIDYNALCGQRKDNIYGIKQLGKSRFKKYFLGKPKDEWFDILDGLIAKGTHGMHLDPASTCETPLDQYHQNLLLMNPMGLGEHTAGDIKYASEQLKGDYICDKTDSACYNEFMLKCAKIFNGVLPPVSLGDFKLLRNGSA